MLIAASRLTDAGDQRPRPTRYQIADRVIVMSSNDDELWTVDDVAAYCRVPKASVYKWNATGTGPTYYRLGRHARYRRSESIKWVEEHIDDSRRG